MIKKLTLCIVQEPNRVLLGMKKRGFGAGLWNGFGGKVEPGETIEDAAKREVLEESGIRILDLLSAGQVEFKFAGEPDILEVSIFKALSFEGSPIETEEMEPRWFTLDKIPFDKMWPDDKYWMPLLLQDKKFKGKFTFESKNKILDHNLEIINV